MINQLETDRLIVISRHLPTMAKELKLSYENLYPMFDTNASTVCGIFESRGVKSSYKDYEPHVRHHGNFYDIALGTGYVIVCEGQIGGSISRIPATIEQRPEQEACHVLNHVLPPVRVDTPHNRKMYELLDKLIS